MSGSELSSDSPQRPTPLTADDLRLALYYVLDHPQRRGESDADAMDRWATEVYARLAAEGPVRVDPGQPPS